MAGGVRDGLPIEDTTPGNLWGRLLAGQVTEVYALSYRGLYRDLPQTLGLELISADAYVYGRFGVLRTHAERAELARALAAEPRWLAVGGLPYWVEPFARRAEAILITVSAISTLFQPAVLAWSSGLPRAAQALFERRDEQELRALEADPGNAAYAYMFDGPVSNDLLRAYYVHMRSFLLREFPSKTFVVGGEQLKQLRAVRARRQR
jgi:hypothetical protein